VPCIPPITNGDGAIGLNDVVDTVQGEWSQGLVRSEGEGGVAGAGDRYL